MKTRNREITIKLSKYIDTIPDYIWSSNTTTFVDIEPQNGSYLRDAYVKLKSYGHSDENIFSRLYGFFESEYMMMYAINKYNISGNFFVLNILNEKECFVDETGYLNFNINKKEYKMRFNVTLTNPPYLDGMHLRFLEKAIDITDDYILFIQPASWLISEKEYKHKTKEVQLKDKIKNIISSIDVVNLNLYFKEAKLGTPGAIILLDKHKKDTSFICNDEMRGKTYAYNHIDEMNKWGDDKEYVLFKENIKNYIKNTSSLLDIRNRRGKYYINFSQLRGNISYTNKNLFDTPDFFTLIPNGLEVETSPGKHFQIGFETKKEAQNCLDYIRLKSVRAALSILKIHNNIDRGELGIIPNVDFKQKWNDQKFLKILGFNSNEILDWIEKNIPNY